MLCAGSLSCVIFPAMLTHIFGGGYRGQESFANLRAGLERYEILFSGILENIDEMWFGRTLLVGIVWILLYFGLKMMGGG